MTHPIDEIRFQQKLLENPNLLDEEMLAFIEANPNKMNAVKNARQFEEQLKDVMNIQVPEGLQERILVRNSFETKAANDSSWVKNIGLFAASFLVVAVGLWVWVNPTQQSVEPTQIALDANGMEQAVIEHILEHANEDPTVMTDYAELSAQEIDELFKFVGATLDKPMDFMSYAGECEVDGEKGLHVVLQEEEGPVTIIVMPRKKLNGMYAFSQDGFMGQMLPVKGAVVAIVGNNEKQLAMAQMHFFQSVSFGS